MNGEGLTWEQIGVLAYILVGIGLGGGVRNARTTGWILYAAFFPVHWVMIGLYCGATGGSDFAGGLLFVATMVLLGLGYDFFELPQDGPLAYIFCGVELFLLIGLIAMILEECGVDL